MSSSGRNLLPAHDHEEMLQLLAERALAGLNEADTARLQELFTAAGIEDDESFDRAAAAAALAMLETKEAAPPSVYTRAAQAAEDFAREMANNAKVRGDPALRLTDAEIPQPRRISGAWLGWLAAAACLALAALGWLQVFANRQQAAAVSLASLRDTVAAAPGAKKLAWAPWENPEIPGVSGNVVWNQSAQKGYMTFRGLPANDPAKEQYQLWIIDERGLAQRVSGGIFNASSESSGWKGEVRAQRLGDELIVEIDPGVHVGTPALFAVTIEKPGGTWVSDMKRKVVVAAAGS